MTAQAKDIIAGRKVFFITPDASLIPQNFCEEYLGVGYECYFVENDKKIPLEKKIEMIVNLFKDVILFFNIDAEIPGISWQTFVGRINRKFNGQIPIGCLYGKRQSIEEKRKIERRYLYDLALAIGCIELEYRKNLNYPIIEKVLYAFQATGRRKNVRAIGTNTCTFTFKYKKKTYSGTLQDISLSHFSFIMPPDTLEIKEYERLDEINFIVRGCHFTSNAVLFMERETEHGNKLFVFTFITETGSSGMDMTLRQRFTPVLYQLMSENCSSLLDGIYKAYIDKRASDESNAEEHIDNAAVLAVENGTDDVDDAEEVEEV